MRGLGGPSRDKWKDVVDAIPPVPLKPSSTGRPQQTALSRHQTRKRGLSMYLECRDGPHSTAPGLIPVVASLLRSTIPTEHRQNMLRWLRRVFCAHEFTRSFKDRRMFLRCLKCTHETPGWRIGQ